MLAQHGGARGPFRDEGGDDAREEDHDDDTVEHAFVDQGCAIGSLEIHADHHHGDGTGGMGGGKAEHQVSCESREAEEESGDISSKGLA